MFNNIFQKYITVKNIIFFVMSIIFIFLIFKMQDIAIMFFASYVIACSLNPIVDKFECRANRKIVSITVLGCALLCIAAVITPLAVLVGNEIINFSNSLPTHFNNLHTYINNLPYIGSNGAFRLDWHGIISSASAYTTDAINEIVNIGLNISSALVYIIVSIIIIYYFMADKALIKDTYLHLFPKNMRHKAGKIIDIISRKIGGYILALFATIGTVGLIMIIGLSCFHVNFAVLLGLITAVLDIIPVVGPAIALIICLIVAYESGLGTILAVIGVFAVAQIIENNFVRPYMFGKFLDLHPVMIYLFLFITAKYMGAAGVIFAPAIAATVCVLIEELYMKNLE